MKITENTKSRRSGYYTAKGVIRIGCKYQGEGMQLIIGTRQATGANRAAEMLRSRFQ